MLFQNAPVWEVYFLQIEWGQFRIFKRGGLTGDRKMVMMTRKSDSK